MVICPLVVLVLASSSRAIHHVLNAFLDAGGICGFPVLSLRTGLAFGSHLLTFFIFFGTSSISRERRLRSGAISRAARSSRESSTR